MRVLFTILFYFVSPFCLAEEAEDPFAVAESQLDAVNHSNSPATLAEAHAQLEEQLPEDTLKQIDEMTSEKEMIMLHFGPGVLMRNEWGLWGGLAPSEAHETIRIYSR